MHDGGLSLIKESHTIAGVSVLLPQFLRVCPAHPFRFPSQFGTQAKQVISI